MCQYRHLRINSGQVDQRCGPVWLDSDTGLLGTRDTEFPAPDGCYRSDSRVFDRIAESISANHSRRAHDYQALVTGTGKIHCTAPVAAKALVGPSWLPAVMIERLL